MAIESEQSRTRLEKLERLKEKGFAYPNKVERKTSSEEVRSYKEGDEAAEMSIAGRIVQMRRMGKASFFHVQDRFGKAQAYLRKNDIAEEEYAQFEEADLGDIVEVVGSPFITKTGEPTVNATKFRILNKCLHPLPEKWHGLSDVEIRYRQRYLDLISNPDVKDIFQKRSQVIREVRSYLDENEFVEVETPILHYIAGGATARPFETHYNALSTDMFLRIALELPLKKLTVGGMERVYEIGRNFRNEGLSKKHNPEFTMLEFYEAFATFETLMDRTEELIIRVAKAVNGTTELSYQGKPLNLSGPYQRVSMKDSIYEIGGVSREEYDVDSVEGIQKLAADRKIQLREPDEWGRSLEDLWDELVEPKIWDPVFITHHPLSISPLARKNADDPRITDRFELIIAGMETANAFSELNDPLDQRERFEEQARRGAAGDEEMPPVDEDFLTALEYGLPPTAGEGIGIDRLVMLMADAANIREVLLFPQLKPEVAQSEEEASAVNE